MTHNYAKITRCPTCERLACICESIDRIVHTPHTIDDGQNKVKITAYSQDGTLFVEINSLRSCFIDLTTPYGFLTAIHNESSNNTDVTLFHTVKDSHSINPHNSTIQSFKMMREVVE